MDGVMIAFVPMNTEWARQPDPHLTLVYCGTIEDLPLTAFNEIAKDALTVARLTSPFSLDVTGVEVFGDELKVDVLKLQTTSHLETARRLVDHWNESEHPFEPHCTIGPEGSAEGQLPTRLYFSEIMVAWGSRHLKFRLGNDY